jgi:hypothetical protein
MGPLTAVLELSCSLIGRFAFGVGLRRRPRQIMFRRWRRFRLVSGGASWCRRAVRVIGRVVGSRRIIVIIRNL